MPVRTAWGSSPKIGAGASPNRDWGAMPITGAARARLAAPPSAWAPLSPTHTAMGTAA